MPPSTAAHPPSDSLGHLARCVPARAWAGLLAMALLAGPGLLHAAEPAKVVKPPAPGTRPAPARSAAKPPAPKAAAPKPIEPLLTRDELRACMTRQDKLRSDGAEAARMQDELGREKADILREGEALKVDLAALDRSKLEDVEAYNSRAKARDRRIEAFEARVPAFNASVGTLEADRAAFARDCDNRKFDEKDEEALRKGR